MASSVTSTISRLLNRYWGIIVLLIWGGALLGLGLLRTAPYGLDEGAARGLLLIWSIFDKIVNPIVTLGIPDFRALLFIPLGAYWPGSLLAAKFFTVVLAFIAVTLFYRWSSRTADAEASLIASTLLLIAPQFINEIDSIDTGVYLLFALAVGNWLNTTYRTAQRAFSGWFFMQLLWVGITITLHPAGLAYPLVLSWAWYKDPLDPRQKRQLLLGLALVTTITLAIRGGWSTVAWGVSPLRSLADAHQAVIGVADPNWLIGVLFALLLAEVVWADRRLLLRVGKACIALVHQHTAHAQRGEHQQQCAHGVDLFGRDLVLEQLDHDFTQHEHDGGIDDERHAQTARGEIFRDRTQQFDHDEQRQHVGDDLQIAGGDLVLDQQIADVQEQAGDTDDKADGDDQHHHPEHHRHHPVEQLHEIDFQTPLPVLMSASGAVFRRDTRAPRRGHCINAGSRRKNKWRTDRDVRSTRPPRSACSRPLPARTP